MKNISVKYNYFLISVFALAPFIAYFTYNFLHIDFNRTIQLLSFVGVVSILIFRDELNPIKFPRYLLFYLLFIIYVFYSAFIQLDRSFDFSYLISNALIGSFNMMFIIENIPISKKYFYSIIRVSKIVLVIAVIVILIQQLFNPSFFMRNTQNFEDGTFKINEDRLYSIYSWFGHIFSAGLSFVPIYFLVVEDLNKKKKRIFIWLIMGVIFVFLSKQRWMMINFLLVLPLLIINKRNKVIFIFKYLFTLPLLIFGVFLLMNIIGIDSSGILKDRILESDKKELSQKSAGTRLIAFKAFNKLFWDNPITGVGNIKYGMGGTGKQEYKLRSLLKGRSSQIHVGYLSLLYMYGLIGAFLFLSFLILLLKKLYTNARLTRKWAPFIGVLGFALNNFVDVNFQLFIMGLIIVLFADSFYSQQLTRPLS